MLEPCEVQLHYRSLTPHAAHAAACCRQGCSGPSWRPPCVCKCSRRSSNTAEASVSICTYLSGIARKRRLPRRACAAPPPTCRRRELIVRHAVMQLGDAASPRWPCPWAPYARPKGSPGSFATSHPSCSLSRCCPTRCSHGTRPMPASGAVGR